MSKVRKKYPKKQKLEIVSLSYDEDQTVKGLAEKFGISENTIYNWRNALSKHREAAFPGNGNPILTEEERKIRQLERALSESRLEVEILKKAVHIFSDTERKFSSL